MSESSVVTRTRSGRVSKAPVRYVPVEQVTDDYGEDEHDSDIDLDDSDSEFSEEDSDEEEDDDSDADENGNLAGFVVDEDPDEELVDDEDTDEELLDSDED